MTREVYEVRNTVPNFGIPPTPYILVKGKVQSPPCLLELKPGDRILIERQSSRGSLMRIEDLLEQHKHYDVGPGWTIGKRDHVWHIYYLGKHIDCWLAEHIKSPYPQPEELRTFPTAVEAVAFCLEMKRVAKWVRPDVNQTEDGQ